MWLNQGVGHVPQLLNVYKKRLLDKDTLTKNSDVQDMDTFRILTDKLLKLNFGSEVYMLCIVKRMLRTAFSIFEAVH